MPKKETPGVVRQDGTRGGGHLISKVIRQLADNYQSKIINQKSKIGESCNLVIFVIFVISNFSCYTTSIC